MEHRRRPQRPRTPRIFRSARSTSRQRAVPQRPNPCVLVLCRPRTRRSHRQDGRQGSKDGLTILTPNEEGKIAATDLRDIGIEDSDHANQECAAYVIKTGYKDARLVQVCINRKNHNKAGTSDLKATKRSANSLTDEQLAVRRQQREDKELRHEAITTAAMTKVSRTDADALIYRYAIDAATADQATLACKFLGLKAAKDGTTYWPHVLKAEAVKNDAALARCALAVASAADDHNLDSNWNDGPLPATFKAWLKKTGWKPRRVAKPTDRK